MGFAGLEERLRYEASQWSQLLPQLPRLVHHALTDTSRQEAILREVRLLRQETARRNRLVLIGVTCFLALVLMVAWAFFGVPLPGRES